MGIILTHWKTPVHFVINVFNENAFSLYHIPGLYKAIQMQENDYVDFMLQNIYVGVDK